MGSESNGVTSEGVNEIRRAVEGHHVCPFCGAVREQPDGVCPRCAMESSPATRQATKTRIGPWYVLQTRNPAAPGMKFETLLNFVRKGRVKPHSIVRGPTTHQLWRFAAHVKGLSREFGICYSCQNAISADSVLCLHCNRLQDLPPNPDVFIEGQEVDARSGVGAGREDGELPLVGEDMVVPTIRADGKYDGEFEPETPDRGNKKATDGFLSAADLATAFKLDFQPKKGKRKKKVSVPAASTGRAYGEDPPPRRRWGRIVFTFLLLAIVGVGVFEYHSNADLHDRVTQWYDAASIWSKDKWANLQKPAPKAQVPPVTPSVLQVQVEPPANVPTRIPLTTQPAAKPDAWDQLYHQTSASAPASAGNMDQVRALFQAGNDAAGLGDFATAAKKYEQIKDFPAELWPGDLEIRLKSARQSIR